MSTKILFVVIGVVFISGLAFFGYTTYQQFVYPPVDSPKGSYVLQVESGSVLADIADQLETDKVLNDSRSLTLTETFITSEPLQTGEYTLSVPATPAQILEQINSQSKSKREELQKLFDTPYVTLTFKEGITMDSVLNQLSENKVATREKLVEYATNPANFDRDRYPFLPEPLDCKYGNLSNCVKYYPEGYLYPDTYNFATPSEPRDVYNKMLDNFQKKVWAGVDTQASKRDFHKVITMASVIERETGRTKGVTAANVEELNQERERMAGVFGNRLQADMLWQSDPTVTYGSELTICQQTFSIPGCVYLDDERVNTKYNTYRYKGYPIGPVTSPQLANIQAVLEPENNNYLFFVSDVTGKKYFSETEQEHLQTITKVQNINQQLGVR